MADHIVEAQLHISIPEDIQQELEDGGMTTREIIWRILDKRLRLDNREMLEESIVVRLHSWQTRAES